MAHFFTILVSVDVFHTIISDPSGKIRENRSHNEGMPSHIHRMPCKHTTHTISAIVKSWDAPFIGEAALEALDEHVWNVKYENETYAQYGWIVQSSGMGKSRLLHEFSKEHFLIPINLRERGAGGTYNLPFLSLSPLLTDVFRFSSPRS